MKRNTIHKYLIYNASSPIVGNIEKNITNEKSSKNISIIEKAT